MEEKESTSYPDIIKESNPSFERVFSRFKILEDKKTDILYIFNSIETIKQIIYKMNQGYIITKTEYNQIEEFKKKGGLSTKIIDIWVENPFNDCQYEYINGNKDSNLLTSLIDNYPFVVDADEVREDVWSLLGEWIAEIWKNWNWWLVKKIELPDWKKGISTLFDHNHSQGWALTFSQDEYHKYGLIEVIDHKVISQDSYNIMFLQREKEPLDRFVRLWWNYHMLQNFDKDGIWFTFWWWSYYYLIHKDISSQWVKIHQIWAYLKSNWDDIRKWFDSFNTFEAEIHKFWKVTFKKSYDDSWKLIWISAFKKKRFGWEEQVRARDKK